MGPSGYEKTKGLEADTLGERRIADAPGLYSVEVRYAGGERALFRVVKE